MPKIQCTVSGLWFSVTTNHRKELVEKFGTAEALEATYVSRDARRLRKEGKTDEEIGQMVTNGELISKTTAPKKWLKAQANGEETEKSTAATTTTVKAETTETEEPEAKADEIEDPDVAAFMADDTDGEATEAAV